MMNSLILYLHIASALFLWATNAYLLINLMQNKSNSNRLLFILIGVASLSGFAVGFSSGASFLAVCKKLGLYLLPSVLYLTAYSFKKNSINETEK